MTNTMNHMFKTLGTPIGGRVQLRLTWKLCLVSARVYN